MSRVPIEKYRQTNSIECITLSGGKYEENWILLSQLSQKLTSVIQMTCIDDISKLVLKQYDCTKKLFESNS